MFRRLPLAYVLMASGVYVIAPTPDELIIHPFIGSLLSRYLNVSIQTGIIMSIEATFSIGFAFLLSSIVIGRTKILDELSRKIAENVAQLSRYISIGLTRVPDLPDGYEAKQNEGLCMLMASPLEHID